MDSDIAIMHSVGLNNLMSQDSIVVNISAQFNRLNSPQMGAVDPVETIWSRRISENPKLYNGTKFRVHSICQSENKVDLNIGVTDYKTYIGTNWADNVNELQMLGSKLHNNSQVFLSDALGVGSLLILRDDNVVLLKRNFHCAEAPGMWDVPGGHAEPKNIVGDLVLDEIDASKMNGEDVCVEIFDSILQEITDEVNIPTSNLEKPLYMGTARNTTSGGRPSLEFLIKCSLTSDDVFSYYSKGSQLEADESTSIRFVPLGEIKDLQTTNKEIWKCLAPSAKGCFILYQMTHGFNQEKP